MREVPGSIPATGRINIYLNFLEYTQKKKKIQSVSLGMHRMSFSRISNKSTKQELLNGGEGTLPLCHVPPLSIPFSLMTSLHFYYLFECLKIRNINRKVRQWKAIQGNRFKEEGWLQFKGFTLRKTLILWAHIYALYSKGCHWRRYEFVRVLIDSFIDLYSSRDRTTLFFLKSRRKLFLRLSVTFENSRSERTLRVREQEWLTPYSQLKLKLKIADSSPT